jgi:hypothetical protein
MSAVTRWTAAGLLLALAAIGSGTSSLISVFWLRTETTTATYHAADSVSVRSDCGSVKVRAGAAGAVSVHSFVRRSFQKPTVTATEGVGTTTLNVVCPWWSWGVGSTVDVAVDVPAPSNVAIGTSAGDVEVDGISGTLSLETSAGSVDAAGLTSSRVSAHSSAGDVQLAFTTAPRQVDATSSAGDITVRLPHAGVSYRVDARSSGGSTDVRVPTDPAANRTIQAHSSAGDVNVAYAS